jgi:hypothetical protein
MDARLALRAVVSASLLAASGWATAAEFRSGTLRGGTPAAVGLQVVIRHRVSLPAALRLAQQASPRGAEQLWYSGPDDWHRSGQTETANRPLATPRSATIATP